MYHLKLLTGRRVLPLIFGDAIQVFFWFRCRLWQARGRELHFSSLAEVNAIEPWVRCHVCTNQTFARILLQQLHDDILSFLAAHSVILNRVWRSIANIVK
jgi:hypothetical protein